MDDMMEMANDHKVSFAKVSFVKGDECLVAFECSADRLYAECVAVSLHDVKRDRVKGKSVHVWECGKWTSDEISDLPTITV